MRSQDRLVFSSSLRGGKISVLDFMITRSEVMPELNAPAPDFTLKNHLHEEVTLSGLRGKTVILAFNPAAFTGICEKEL